MRANARQAACASLGAAFALLCGCASTPPAAAPSKQAASGKASGAAPGPGAAEPAGTTALAERAKHDVAQMKKLGVKPGADPAPGAATAEAPPHAPPEVQWIIPQRGADDAATAAAAAVQAPLASTPPQGPPAPVERPGGQVVAPQPDREHMLQLTVDLCSELYRQGAYSDAPMRELLLIAATSLVTPDRALAPEALPGLTDRERELLGRMQEFFAAMGRDLHDKGDPEAIVKAVEQLNAALGRQAALKLPRAALCTRVGGFGDYDEFKRNEAGRYAFLAHNGQQAVVYVEVADFTSTLNEQQQWVTELSQQLVLYNDRDGIPVWREPWQPGVDSSRNRRGDFFIVQIVTLPEQLSVGRYQLKIHVRDEKSHAEAETALDLEMVADPKMTSAKPRE